MKKNVLLSILNVPYLNFTQCPLVFVLWDSEKFLINLLNIIHYFILWFHVPSYHLSMENNPTLFHLSSYECFSRPLIILVGPPL